MSEHSQGGVFHPDHDELHGITVVIYTSTPRTYVGRWDADHGEFVQILGADMHETSDETPDRDAWVGRTRQFGVATRFQSLTIPKSEIDRVVPLRLA